ncbi:hypothetical protein [Halomarina rubra]|uniref:Uncharacterized protein n=1 Tax=Halomarina rubra TaxID=2071873 RepID=A0ABD6AYI1_9EURY|nr:hypothetical protein [Halomarina rubra]
MEPGTDRRELEAAWRRLERRRRAGDRLAVATAAVLAGAVALLLGLAVPTRLCSQGAGYDGCVTSTPDPSVQVGLLVVGLVAVAVGVLALERVFLDA